MRVLAEMDLAKKAIHSLKAAPSGRHVAPHILTFLNSFENVKVDLVLNLLKIKPSRFFHMRNQNSDFRSLAKRGEGISNRAQRTRYGLAPSKGAAVAAFGP